jgi:hypothetical protein
MKILNFAVSVVSLFLVITHSLSAQSHSDEPLEQALQRVRPEGIRANVAFLADDLLEGRQTGTRGYMLAAKYVAAQFEEMGLKPAGDNGTYFQNVRFRHYKLVPEQSSMSIIRNGQRRNVTIDKDCIIGTDAVHSDISVDADVVFVGYGVTAPEFHYDDYAGIEAKGKVVALLFGAPSKFGSAPGGYYSDLRVKEANAVAHGAVGLLVVWAGPITEHYPFSALVGFNRAPHMRWLDARGVPNDAQPQLQGFAVLSIDLATTIFEGSPKSLNDALAVAKAGEPQAFALPIKVAIHTVSQYEGAEGPNVAAILPGSDLKFSAEYVLFTAHLDHLGVGEPVKGDNIYNGAVDNASGAAMLTEVARSLSLSRPPRRSILFLAVTGEEEGLLGSDYYAHNMTVPTIVANIKNRRRCCAASFSGGEP